MGPAEFATFVVLTRVALRPKLPDDNFGLRPRGMSTADWHRVKVGAIGVAGALEVGWALLGTGALPWWACLVAAWVAGGWVERLTEWYYDRT